MRIRTAVFAVAVIVLSVIPNLAKAQSSSQNTYSPYTFYGIGDISLQGPTHLRSMGGASIAYREPTSINYMNPASYSAMPRKSFIMTMGTEGANYYLKTSDKKTSKNTFNVREVAILFPLAGKLAMGVSVTPYSSVGYVVKLSETDPTVIGSVGNIDYRYVGDGDLAQAKAGIGWEPFRNFSIGAEMVYYIGDIERSAMTEITSFTGSGSYSNTQIYDNFRVSHITANFGIQYNPVFNQKRVLTLGATFQPRTNLNPDATRTIVQNYVTSYQTIDLAAEKNKDFYLPATLSGGLYYHTNEISVGADYVWQEWGQVNKGSLQQNVGYRNTNTVRAGISYTPNRIDVRNYMKRVTYRLGLRYNEYYMKFNGHDVTDMAVSAGMGFPLRGYSAIEVGFEYGRRGTTSNNLINENYFKFSIGFSLFGSDWFKKFRYD